MDEIIRAVTKDGFVKISAISARATVERAREIHGLSPTASAARSMACASGERSSSGQPAAIWAIGVTETRLLAMGMPYSLWRSSAVSTRCSAVRVMRS